MSQKQTKEVTTNTMEPDIEYVVSDDLVKGWLFNAIVKRYNIKTDEEAKVIIPNKGIHTRIIFDGKVSYITILDKKQRVIAQAREDYFLVPYKKESCNSESSDQLTESSIQSTNKPSTLQEKPKKRSPKKSKAQSNGEILSSNVTDNQAA